VLLAVALAVKEPLVRRPGVRLATNLAALVLLLATAAAFVAALFLPMRTMVQAMRTS